MAKKQVIRAAVVSHKGCERDNNEDNFFFNGDLMPLADMDKGACIVQEFDDANQLYAICDGMGGANLGERAAYISVRQMVNFAETFAQGAVQQNIEKFSNQISQLVADDAKKNHARIEGTTLAMAAIVKQVLYVANVGDSRVYRMRDGELKQLSDDHSEVNRMRAAGLLTEEQARKATNNNVITRYIGMDASKRPVEFAYQSKHTVVTGDKILLCSDGVCDLLSRAQMAGVIQNAASPAEAARNLVMYSLELGGKDNTTAMVLEVK